MTAKRYRLMRFAPQSAPMHPNFRRETESPLNTLTTRKRLGRRFDRSCGSCVSWALLAGVWGPQLHRCVSACALGFETVESPGNRDAGGGAVTAVKIVEQTPKFAGAEAGGRDGADAVEAAPYV